MDPAMAEMFRYKNTSSMDNAGFMNPYNWGVKAREFMSKPNAVGDMLNQGIMPGALAFGLGGAALGVGGSLAKNMASDEEHQTPVWRNALLAALAGGGLGAYLGYQRQQQPKLAGFSGYNRIGQGAPNAMAQVASMIASAPGLDPGSRQQYLQVSRTLSQSDASQLLSLLQIAGSAGIGALLARFFLGKGLIRSAFGAAIGGLIGSAFTGSGRNSNIQETDSRGRPYLL
jgi:hypothetical protein